MKKLWIFIVLILSVITGYAQEDSTKIDYFQMYEEYCEALSVYDTVSVYRTEAIMWQNGTNIFTGDTTQLEYVAHMRSDTVINSEYHYKLYRLRVLKEKHEMTLEGFAAFLRDIQNEWMPGQEIF